MKSILFSLFSAFAIAQTALVPASTICPNGQQTVATQTGSVGTAYVLLSFSCQQLGSGVTINTATTPPTVTAPTAPSGGGGGTTVLLPTTAGPGTLIVCTPTNCTASLDSSLVFYQGVAPTGPGPCSNSGTGALAFDVAGYIYKCTITNPTANPPTAIWMRSTVPMVTTW
jgi:hypothetical protein